MDACYQNLHSPEPQHRFLRPYGTLTPVPTTDDWLMEIAYESLSNNKHCKLAKRLKGLC